MEVDINAEYISRVETWNSGGNVMLDIVHLKDGQILVISDEVVCRYSSVNEFMADQGNHDYANNTIELYDFREMNTV